MPKARGGTAVPVHLPQLLALAPLLGPTYTFLFPGLRG